MVEITFWQVVALLVMVVALIVAGTVALMMAGAYIMFKGRNAVPGERFIGGVPKGQVFTLPEADDVGDFPGEPNAAEKNILQRTEQFLKTLGGK